MGGFGQWEPPRVKVVSNISNIHLRFVGGDEKGTHPVTSECKYGDLTRQVGGFSNLREQNMFTSLASLISVNGCVGEEQQRL